MWIYVSDSGTWSIKSLEFGENIHVEVLYPEVHDHIWSVLAYVRGRVERFAFTASRNRVR